jgi:hypothetical protein
MGFESLQEKPASKTLGLVVAALATGLEVGDRVLRQVSGNRGTSSTRSLTNSNALLPLRAENGDKANWSGMLRVCSLKWRVERRYSLGNRKETRVDSAGKCVVCLKGFEDDGRSLTVTGRHYPKQPPSAGLPGSLTKG